MEELKKYTGHIIRVVTNDSKIAIVGKVIFADENKVTLELADETTKDINAEDIKYCDPVNLDYTFLKRIDELQLRKHMISKIVEKLKDQLEDKISMLLSKAFDTNIEMKTSGEIVFYERWIEEIDKEIQAELNNK